MTSEEQKFKALLKKYLEGEADQDETAWLETWYMQFNEGDKESFTREDLDNAGKQMWESFEPSDNARHVFKLWPLLAATASIIIIFGAGLLYYKVNQESKSSQNELARNDVRAGGIRATLILANGKRIILDGARNGVLANQAGIKITKSADGRLVYTVEDSKTGSSRGYNTIETPRGGQYQIRLPDGTQVWLNAASSLKYPLSFADSKFRKVELKGEAYFEVAHNKKQPFRVSTLTQEVEVLGTHFDIKSYDDEAFAKTTLLEGSVKLNGSILLKPGEQGITQGAGTRVKQVDASQEIDWKNNQFILDNEELQLVMSRLARWYNVEIVYEDKIEDLKLFGVVSNSRNISGVLKLIERTGKVKFRIEGKKVTVLRPE